MRVIRLRAALTRVAKDLDGIGCRWALVGGLAVAVRILPRQTRDVDVVVAVESDSEAEDIVRTLFNRGYRQLRDGVHQDRATQRLWLVRLITPGEDTEETIFDLLFQSARIEHEIVADADRVEVSPGLVVPVAKTGHLLALKLLAGRTQDLVDVEAILQTVDAEEIERARQALRLIELRQDSLDRNLLAELELHLQRRDESGR